MNTIEYGIEVIHELEETIGEIDPKETEALLEKIRQANRIFVSGAGRSLLMLKAFAMRLMQLGFRVHVVGEVTTPGIKKGDLLIIGSGSGETGSLILNAQKAKSLGVTVALISIFPQSTIGKLADLVVKINTSTEKALLSSGRVSIQPGGSTFEQTLLLLGDMIILTLMGKAKECISVMALHANLE